MAGTDLRNPLSAVPKLTSTVRQRGSTGFQPQKTLARASIDSNTTLTHADLAAVQVSLVLCSYTYSGQARFPQHTTSKTISHLNDIVKQLQPVQLYSCNLSIPRRHPCIASAGLS